MFTPDHYQLLDFAAGRKLERFGPYLLDQVAGPLQAPNLTLIQLDYSENRGDLALQVRASDFAELEQLRQRLSEAGLAVQMGSASREEGGVTARVVIGS